MHLKKLLIFLFILRSSLEWSLVCCHSSFHSLCAWFCYQIVHLYIVMNPSGFIHGLSLYFYHIIIPYYLINKRMHHHHHQTKGEIRCISFPFIFKCCNLSFLWRTYLAYIFTIQFWSIHHAYCIRFTLKCFSLSYGFQMRL